MRRDPPAETQEEILKFIQKIGNALSAKIEGIHFTTPYICDHCQNDNKEAFPYHVYDGRGHFWANLCNDCYDLLGCGIVCDECKGFGLMSSEGFSPDNADADCPRCGGSGFLDDKGKA